MAITNPKVAIEYPERGIGGTVVPASLKGTLRRCLQRDPDLRPTARQLLSEADGLTFVQAEIGDFDAGAKGVLEEFYISLDGPGWERRDGWLVEGSQYCDWWGVECETKNNITTVVALNLEDNGLNGQMKFSIGNLRDLKRISLANNYILGFIPFTLSRAQDLVYMNFSGNLFDSAIPKEYSRLSQLKVLDLSRNMITDTIPASLSNCTQLEYLNLAENRLTGTVPDTFANLHNLEYLNLSHNQLSGLIPGSLGELRDLQTLDLSYNEFDGLVNSTLQEIETLTYLNISHNQIKVIEDFDKFDELESCDFTGNPWVCPISERAAKCGAFCSREPTIVPGIAVASVFALILGLAAGIVFVITVEKARIKEESGVQDEDDDGF